MKLAPRRALATALACLVLLSPVAAQDKTPAIQSAAAAAPIKVLLVAGGCCHDYATQVKLLKAGIEKRIHAKVDVAYNPSTTTATTFEVYESDDWAKGYDCIVHDECSASVTDQPYIGRILAAHKSGVPAVNLHCAMHSYRWGDFRNPVEPGAENSAWYEMIGVQSTAHGAKTPIDVSYADDAHPITSGLKPWKTINEELYNNVRVYGGTQALASGTQMQAPRAKELKQNPDAKPAEVVAVVAWTNLYGPNKTRIFSTSLGHDNETVGDARYLELISRGILWATHHITSDGSPAAGYGK